MSITFLPLASSAENEELLLGTSEKILRATLLPEGEALPRPGGTEDSWSFERPSSSSAKSSLCLASTAQWPRSCAGGNWRGCQHLARQQADPLGEVRRQLQLEEFDACTGNGCSGAILSASHRLWARRGAQDGVTHGWRPCLGAHSRTRSLEAAAGGSRASDALSGNEQSTGVLIDDRARVVVRDVPYEPLGAQQKPLRGHLLHKQRSAVALRAQTQPELQIETAQQPSARVQNMSLLATWIEEAGPETGAGADGGWVPR